MSDYRQLRESDLTEAKRRVLEDAKARGEKIILNIEDQIFIEARQMVRERELACKNCGPEREYVPELRGDGACPYCERPNAAKPWLVCLYGHTEYQPDCPACAMAQQKEPRPRWEP